jgi:hypothetical protein
MLPKAVLSWVGRLVGIAAVVASPLVARAAEASDSPSATGAKDSHEGASAPEPRSGQHLKASATHSHAKTKARKKATHKDAKPAKALKEDGKSDKRNKNDKSDKANDSPEVIAEHASTRSVPKPSKTPLPTVAAAATRPLLAASVRSSDAPPIDKSFAKNVDRGHAAEPRKTPILRASTRIEPTKVTKKAKPPCVNAPVEITRGAEDEAFPLTKCDGSVLPAAVNEISVLVRPGSAVRPQRPIDDATKSDELAPGIKRIDGRLVERIQLVVDHFSKPGKTAQLFVVSGYRPTSKGSFHASGRAIDFRLEGTENTDLVAFCKTLDDTGCGFYPNSSFIHMDVRDAGAGHVAWIDASEPGGKPDYVASWPPPPKQEEADPVKLLARLDELEFLPTEEASEKAHVDAKSDEKPACAAGEEDSAAVVQKKRDEN